MRDARANGRGNGGKREEGGGLQRHGKRYFGLAAIRRQELHDKLLVLQEKSACGAAEVAATGVSANCTPTAVGELAIAWKTAARAAVVPPHLLSAIAAAAEQTFVSVAQLMKEPDTMAMTLQPFLDFWAQNMEAGGLLAARAVGDCKLAWTLVKAWSDFLHSLAIVGHGNIDPTALGNSIAEAHVHLNIHNTWDV